MASFFDWMLGRGANRGSGSKAKERLQFILVHDRINLPPERLEAMKQEILDVISKYVAVDSANVEIALHKRNRENLLVAEIPFTKTAENSDADDDLVPLRRFDTPPDADAPASPAADASAVVDSDSSTQP